MKVGAKYVLLFLFSLVTFSACEKDTTASEIASADIDAIKTAVVDGVWKITYYFDDKDETPDFNSFWFDFKADGVLMAESNQSAVSGSWSIVADSNDSSADNPSDSGVDFDIFFGSFALLEELNEDWDIVSFTDTTIELKDVSGGDGSIDYLTFEKIQQ